MSEQDQEKKQGPEQLLDSLDLQKMISDLESQTAAAINQTPQKASMTGTWKSGPGGPDPDEEIKKSSIMEPPRPEIMTTTTKIHSFDKPVFITLPGCKVYTIFGNVPALRTPEVSAESVEMHVINDDELGYSILQPKFEENGQGIFWADTDRLSISVVCGKKFGTRKLDALASILLKLNAHQIIVQKYSYNKSNKSAQWVPEYNRQVTKLEHHIHQFLRNDGQ